MRARGQIVSTAGVYAMKYEGIGLRLDSRLLKEGGNADT